MRKSRHPSLPRPDAKSGVNRSIPAGSGIIMPGGTSKSAGNAGLPDWEQYTEKVAAWLTNLPGDSYLVISAKRGWCYVQFAIGHGFLRAEAMSNHYIVPPEYKLSDNDVETLVALGWRLPTKRPSELSAAPIGGSPNFWCDFNGVDYRRVASLAVESLSKVYRIAHPDDLNVLAFAKDT